MKKHKSPHGKSRKKYKRARNSNKELKYRNPENAKEKHGENVKRLAILKMEKNRRWKNEKM